MDRSSFFKRTLNLVKKHDLFLYKELVELINNHLTEMSFIKKYLLKIESKFLIDIFSYENSIWEFHSTLNTTKEELIKLRSNTISKTYNADIKCNFNILNYFFEISENILIVESEFNWNNFKRGNSLKNLDIVKSNEGYLTLIKPSLIENISFDEIILLNFDLILLDLKAYGAKFSGWDIFNIICDDKMNAKKRTLLKEKLQEKIFIYLILYGVFDFAT